MTSKIISFPSSWSISEGRGASARRLRAEIVLDRHSFLCLTLRRRRGGLMPKEIVRNPDFLESLDRKLAEILGAVLECGGDRDDDNLHHVASRAASYGFFDDGRKSPHLSYQINPRLAKRLKALSAHQEMALLQAASGGARHARKVASVRRPRTADSHPVEQISFTNTLANLLFQEDDNPWKTPHPA